MSSGEPATAESAAPHRAPRAVSWMAVAWPGFAAAAGFAIVPCWTTLIAWPAWARHAGAAALLVIPFIWLLLARVIAGRECLRCVTVLDGRDWLVLVILAAGLVALQARFLSAPLAWRGDEDFHVRRAELFAQSLHDALTGYPMRWIATGLACGAVVGVLATRRRWGGVPIALIAGWAVAATITMTLEYVSASLYGQGGRLWIAEDVFRYPPGGLVLGALVVSHDLGTLASEWANRMIAFVPYVTICGLTYATARTQAAGRPTATLAAVVAATLPLLFYHAAITYLEMAVLALGCYIVLLFQAHDTVDRGFVLRVATAASVLVPIKETGAPLAAAAAVALAARVLTGYAAGWPRRLALTLGAWLLIAIPGALYLAFLVIIGGGRRHPLEWMQLLQWGTYRQALVAGWTQFGPVGIALLATGAVVSARGRRSAWALAFAALNAVCCVVLFFSDHASYIGYSRFTLCFAPLVVLAVASLARPMLILGRHGARIQSALLLAAAVSGYASAPRSLERRENWGSPHADTAEYYYPYDRAVDWLSAVNPKPAFYVSGLNYPYHVLFYVRKFDLDFRQCIGVNADGLSLAESASTAAANGAAYLLFHHPSPVDQPPGPAPPGARFVQRFAIGRRALDLYDVSGVVLSAENSGPVRQPFAERFIGSTDAHEPDDSPTQARPILPGEPSTHSIGAAGLDIDWMWFDLATPSSVDITLSGSVGDTFMLLFSSADLAVPLASDNDRGPRQFSRIQCPRLSAGRYYLRVEQIFRQLPIAAYETLLTIGDVAAGPTEGSS